MNKELHRDTEKWTQHTISGEVIWCDVRGSECFRQEQEYPLLTCFFFKKQDLDNNTICLEGSLCVDKHECNALLKKKKKEQLQLNYLTLHLYLTRSSRQLSKKQNCGLLFLRGYVLINKGRCILPVCVCVFSQMSESGCVCSGICMLDGSVSSCLHRWWSIWLLLGGAHYYMPVCETVISLCWELAIIFQTAEQEGVQTEAEETIIFVWRLHSFGRCSWSWPKPLRKYNYTSGI